MGDSFKAYGFEYCLNNYRCQFRVLARSEAEAKEKYAAMREAAFVGELLPNERVQQPV